MRRKTKLWGLVVILVVILIALVAYFPKGTNAETVKIGVSLPLTGEAASFGEGALAGIDLAVSEINSKGGINGRELEVIIEDDQCNSRGGINTLTKLSSADNVDFIVGPLCSAAAGPGLPVVQERGIPTIIWGSAPHLTLDKDYVFRTYPSDAFQGKFSAEYLYNTLGKRKVAVVYVQNDWGQGIRDVFVEEFERLGGEVVFDEAVNQEATDMRSIVTKMADTDLDSIYFPAYPSIGVVGLKQIQEQDINVPILGGDAFETDEVIKSGQANGVLYTLAKFSSPDSFKQRVEAVSDHDINFMTPLAYDAINIAAEVMGEAGTDPVAIRSSLRNYRSSDVVSLPSVSFDSNGDLASADFDVKKVVNNEAVIVS